MILPLIKWLEEGGGIERELPLLRALASCPLGPAGGRLSPEQLQQLRPDAYTSGALSARSVTSGGVARGGGVIAPLLRGEGGRAAQPTQSQGRGRSPTVTQRIEGCCESLIGEVDLWFEGESPPALSVPPALPPSTWPPKGAMTRITRAMEAFRVRLMFS